MVSLHLWNFIFSRKLSDLGVGFTKVCWNHNIMSHNILRAHCVLDIYFLHVTFTTPPLVYLGPDWFHASLKGFYTMWEIRWKIIKNPEEWKSFKNVMIRNIFFLFPDSAGSKLLCISLLVKNSNKYKPFEDRGMKVNLQTGWYLIKWAYNLQVETVMD